MPRANNRLALNRAKEMGWYCRFDRELRDLLTCEASHPDATLDLIRGLMSLKRRDPGPSTPETIRARREYYEKHPLRTAP